MQQLSGHDASFVSFDFPHSPMQGCIFGVVRPLDSARGGHEFRGGRRVPRSAYAPRAHFPAVPGARPWELYLIEGRDQVEGIPAGSIAVLIKIHHAAVEGASGAEILQATHDLEPGANYNVVITNVPGPGVQLHAAGARATRQETLQ